MNKKNFLPQRTATKVAWRNTEFFVRKQLFLRETPWLIILLFSLFITSCPNPFMKDILGIREVFFNANGGTPVPSKQNVWRDEKVKIPSSPVKADYDFAGWYSDNETFLIPWDFNTQPYDGMTLHAYWVPQAVNAQVPNITVQPQSAGYLPNVNPATLSVTASVSDGGNLTYQWFSNTENNTTGGTPVGTNSSFTPPTGADGTINYYYVVVTNTIDDNGDGGIKIRQRISNIAVISFTTVPLVHAQTPVINTQPTGASYIQNSTPVTPLTVAASVTDSGTLTYQWYGNGSPIGGATGASYTPLVTVVGTINYHVVVTNTIVDNGDGGNKIVTVTSSTVAVVVNALVHAQTPTIATQPINTTYAQNATTPPLTVTANITDGGTLSYQWYRNTTASTTGGTIVGTNSNSFQPPTDTLETVYYYVVVTNTNNNVNGVTIASATSDVVAVEVTSGGWKFQHWRYRSWRRYCFLP